MDTDELKQRIAAGDSAYMLLDDAMPRAESRFNRAADNLAKLLKEIREHFPDARFYTSGGDGFCLVLGDTHSGEAEVPNHELAALQSSTLKVMGGDW